MTWLSCLCSFHSFYHFFLLLFGILFDAKTFDFKCIKKTTFLSFLKPTRRHILHNFVIIYLFYGFLCVLTIFFFLVLVICLETFFSGEMWKHMNLVFIFVLEECLELFFFILKMDLWILIPCINLAVLFCIHIFAITFGIDPQSYVWHYNFFIPIFE